MAAEHEVKLDLHPTVELGDPVSDIEGADVEHVDPVRLRATYFDTADLRLIRAGATVRYRPEADSDPWQVKHPIGDADTDGIVRDERAYPGNDEGPPAAVTSAVAALTRGAPLVPVATLLTERTRVRVHADGQVAVEVTDDDVEAHVDGRLVARFRELEVEGDHDRIRREVVDRLVDAGASRSGNRPKLVRALGPAAEAPPDLVVPELPTPSTRVPVVDVVSRAMLVDLDRMIRFDPGTRLGEDVEALHQMRVATRRLRTTLRTYRPVLDREWADSLRDDLRPLAAALGAVRDLDVLVARVETDLAALDPADAVAGPELCALLQLRRDRARGVLLEQLEGPGYGELLDRLLAAATTPRVLEPDAPAGPTLAPLVRQAWKGVRRAVAAGDDQPADDQHPDDHLHDVRLRTKRLRYAADAVQPALGQPAADLSRAAGRVQDVLGAWQDAVVAIEMFRTLRDEVDPGVAYLLGVLAARAGRRRDRAAGRWPAAWRRLRRHRKRI
ncbi:CYTH and CHAD domain-containing protein [Euzebya rosea]|uniref:CYTH and CHAD domain-containing protein n=1 Tax=Euzebya rosea TaxID=2052804 RepID=UPI000D3E29B7|nr:CYTH and CHAD domain-containing protein [Euzebya rosea]